LGGGGCCSSTGGSLPLHLVVQIMDYCTTITLLLLCQLKWPRNAFSPICLVVKSNQLSGHQQYQVWRPSVTTLAVGTVSMQSPSCCSPPPSAYDTLCQQYRLLLLLTITDPACPARCPRRSRRQRRISPPYPRLYLDIERSREWSKLTKPICLTDFVCPS